MRSEVLVEEVFVGHDWAETHHDVYAKLRSLTAGAALVRSELGGS
ncbi:MAG: hypothetical protein ACRDYF_05135 [Acidimicrobiia bacterium]